jgi:hypothetical protein
MNAKCRDKFLVQSALIPKERDTLLMAELVRANTPLDSYTPHMTRTVVNRRKGGEGPNPRAKDPLRLLAGQRGRRCRRIRAACERIYSRSAVPLRAR